ncbi:MAG: BlaI/MecI/CopY family transcriptional regulator [Actinomycetia bacterium]|nr:BlaI/MecI/CopY family transcriptional regulator [Actinomycetes bacterium]
MSKTPHLESAVMDVLWDSADSLSPGEVQRRLGATRPLAYTTVKTVLVRLWGKGRLVRARHGRAYEYAPTETREEYAARIMEEVLDTGRDRNSTLVHFVASLSASERRRLRRALEDQWPSP